MHGGEIVGMGTAVELAHEGKTLTGKYLSGKLRIEAPKARRDGSGKAIEITGARANNLKRIRARFPIGKFIAVTGVSGSGKSSLVNETLAPRRV